MIEIVRHARDQQETGDYFQMIALARYATPVERNRSRIGVLPLDPCAEYNASCAGVPGDAMCWARRTRCGGDAVFGGAKSSGARFSEDSDRAD
jgi:hypothetical protein